MPTSSAQRLLSLLPAVYREDAFLGRYLAAFEDVLLGLEQRIDGIARLFDPQQAPDDFLPWLSSWVAFTLRAHVDVNQQRNFLSRVVPLYRRRGTRQNLQDLLAIFTRGLPTVEESATEPHRFKVTLRLPPATPEVRLQQSAIARALIDLEKPAHTVYDIDLVFPTMQINQTSTIGVDTLLGSGTGN